MACTLTSLPEELVLRIFGYLHRLDDLYSIMLTNKLFFRISHDISSHDISQMALRTGDFLPGLRPYQHTLLLPSARQLADWVMQGHEIREKLASSMHAGIDGLVALAMEKAPITLEDIRKAYRWKQDVLNPLSQEMDQICGRPSDPSDFMTVCEDPSLTLLVWAIYGELFHLSFSYLYSDEGHCEDPVDYGPFDCIMRFKFLVYCVPDVNSFTYMEIDRPEWFDAIEKTADKFQQLSLNYAVREYLVPSLWEDEIHELVPETFNGLARDNDWNWEYLSKDRLFLSSVMFAGTRALDVLQAGRLKRQNSVEPSEELVSWLRDLHSRISALPEDRSADGEVSRGEPYDLYLKGSWVNLVWDQQTTLWAAGPYDLDEEFAGQHEDEEDAWDEIRLKVGIDPARGYKDWKLMGKVEGES